MRTGPRALATRRGHLHRHLPTHPTNHSQRRRCFPSPSLRPARGTMMLVVRLTRSGRCGRYPFSPFLSRTSVALARRIGHL